MPEIKLQEIKTKEELISYITILKGRIEKIRREADMFDSVPMVRSLGNITTTELPNVGLKITEPLLVKIAEDDWKKQLTYHKRALSCMINHLRIDLVVVPTLPKWYWMNEWKRTMEEAEAGVEILEKWTNTMMGSSYVRSSSKVKNGC